MALLNYTTTVPAEKTVSQIITILAKSGASKVLTDYNEGRPIGVAFALDTPTGLRHYRLPVDPAPVEQVLRKQRVAPRYVGREQATRVAWRIVKDWVEAQLAIIETQMVKADQVFLPYMLTGEGDGTVYDLYLHQQLAIGKGGHD
jgi:hypothetical protein